MPTWQKSGNFAKDLGTRTTACTAQTAKNPSNIHEGSGLGSTVNDIRRAYPNANVQKGFSIYGHEVRTNKAKVEKWLLSAFDVHKKD